MGVGKSGFAFWRQTSSLCALGHNTSSLNRETGTIQTVPPAVNTWCWCSPSSCSLFRWFSQGSTPAPGSVRGSHGGLTGPLYPPLHPCFHCSRDAPFSLPGGSPCWIYQERSSLLLLRLINFIDFRSQETPFVIFSLFFSHLYLKES